MNIFHEENFPTLKHYVYRLIDPRNDKTFYVGKGSGNRVFAHVKEELDLANSANPNGRNKDDLSSKLRKIRDIRMAGLNVKHVIHRYGMSEEAAIEVEAALIDAYSELGILTNSLAGHDAERGMVEADELIKRFNMVEYTEPNDIDYVIIKTKHNTVRDCKDSLYEASRKAWQLSLERVRNIKYVLATINGVVKEVYRVGCWYQSEEPGKVEFDGHVAPENVREIFVDKLLPKVYRQPGNASSALYKKAN